MSKNKTNHKLRNRGSRLFTLVVLGSVVFLLVGVSLACESTAPVPAFPRTTFSSPLSGTAEAYQLDHLATTQALQGDMNSVAAAATISALEQKMTVEAVAVENTRQAELVAAIEWQTAVAATAVAWDVTSTAQAIEYAMMADQATSTAEAANAHATSTAEAANAYATATAEAEAAMATQTAHSQSINATSTAEVEATTGARAFEIQSTQDAYNAMAVAQSAESTRQSVVATRSQIDREKDLGAVRDYGAVAVVFLGIIGGSVLLFYVGVFAYEHLKKRPQPVPTNFMGQPIPFLTAVGPRRALLNERNQPGPVLMLDDVTGQVTAPQYRDSGQEERTTARGQKVELETTPRLNVGGGRRGQQAEIETTPPPASLSGLRSVRIFRQLEQAMAIGAVPNQLAANVQEVINAVEWTTVPNAKT